MNISSILAELDETARSNLLQFVLQETGREYQPKHRTKASKLSPDALQSLKLSGERLRAEVREQGKILRIDMTFPLFDLASDYTFVQCSCQRDAISLEAQRCHHMYFLQKLIAESLQALQSEGPSEDSSIDSLRLLLQDADDGDRWLKEFRQVAFFDPQAWTLREERQARLRYEPEALWKPEPISGAVQAGPSGIALFERLFTALDTGESIHLESSDETIALEEAPWQLDMRERAESLELRVIIHEAGKSLAIKGAGILTWIEGTKTLLLTRVRPNEAAFLERVAQEPKSYPIELKEQVLKLLSTLDPKVFELEAGEELPEVPATYSVAVRLTPFSKGGMKIELRLLIDKELPVRPREGREKLPSLGLKNRRLFVRDFQSEDRLLRSALSVLPLERLPQPELWLWIAYNDPMALEVVGALEALKDRPEFLVEWPSFLAKKQYSLAPPLQSTSLKVSVGEKKDWFAVDGWMELDDGQKLSLRELLKTLKRQSSYLKLPDGRWALIPEHFRQRLEPLAQAVETDADELSIDLAALDSEVVATALESFPFEDESKKFWRLVSRARRAQSLPVALPKGLRADMRPYQLDGFRWLSRLADWGLGACLADDMGLGKTLQTLAILLKRSEMGPSLVIAPSSLSYNWMSEAARFTPDLQIILLRDLADRGENQSFGPKQVLVASYGLVMRYAERLASTQWNVMVLDEAQLIKNAMTKTAQAVQTLHADWTLALSGTPIENHLGDLWSLFRTISPGLFGEWERFRRSYVLPIEKGDSAAARERLKQKLAPFVLRRMKKDYLHELPAKTEVDLWIDLSPEEQGAYDALRGEAIEKVALLMNDAEKAASPQTAMQVLAALTRLRQAACDRRLIDPEWTGTSSKLDALAEKLAELKEAGHAALVFSQFTRFLKLAREQLEAQGIKTLYLDGETAIPERARLVTQFQDGHAPVFLISLKAGGTGLNLTRASYVFHLDPWWNPATENQATDRAYRMGQKQAVTVYRMRSRKTIEELIHAMHADKKALIEGVLEGREPGAMPQWKELWTMLWPETKRAGAKPRLERDSELS